MSEEKTVEPCFGAMCCQESSCMNLPGMRCSKSRGPTNCIGASMMGTGTCACLFGACSNGKCPLQHAAEPLPEVIDAASEPLVSAPAGTPQALTQDTSASRMVKADFSVALGLIFSAALAVLVGSTAVSYCYKLRRDHADDDNDAEDRNLFLANSGSIVESGLGH